MAATKKQILESLPSLTPEERAEIVKWCGALGVRGYGIGENDWADFAYRELARCLAAYHRTSFEPNIFAFARARSVEYKKLCDAVDVVVARIEDWWPGQNKTTKVALLQYLSKLAFDVVSRRSMQVTWSRLAAALLEIEATVNDAFPGWLRAGIFQQRVLARILGDQHVRNEPNQSSAPGRRKRLAVGGDLSHGPR